MAETGAIVGIFGAVDRAVQADPVARLRVSHLLPQYRDPNLQWYDEFRTWLGETAGPESPEPAFPGLREALVELAESREPPRRRVLARRMFAIAIAARAFPEMKEGDNELRRYAISALRTSPDTVAESGARAEGLYRLLAGEEQPVYREAAEVRTATGLWEGVVSTAADTKAIPDTVGMFPRPCSGRLVSVPGVDGPAAAFRTEQITDEIDFEHATRFIEPVNWKTCMPTFWCDVDPIPDPKLAVGERRYREVVSTHCDDSSSAGFWAETELMFNFMWLPGKDEAEAAVANYQLAEGRPHKHDRIVVDEGSLVVAKMEDGRVLVTTTKRIKFTYPFSSEALALTMCALGYADIAGVLLACAATRGKEPGELDAEGTEFPGVQPVAAPAAAGRDTAARSAGQAGSAGVFQDWVDIWARAMREGAKVLERGGGGSAGAPKKPDRPES